MTRFLIKRILISIPLLISMTFLSFAIMKMAPGDPTIMFTDPTISAQDLQQVRENMGLNDSLPVQYVKWLSNVVSGNFGYSLQNGKPVLQAITERLPATLLLSVTSLVLILLITFPLGLETGYRAGGRFDQIVTVLSFLGLALPTFWVGLMLILGLSLQLDLFPTSGFMDHGLQASGFWTRAVNIAHHMVLPLLTIIIGGIAGLTRYNRFGIIDILSKDYITAARSRGISERVIVYKHAFKNAALPIVTILGLSLPGLIGGSFVIEYIFAWPGMGQLGIAAIFARDYPILMGTILFSSILIIIGNTLADMAYAWIDPRISS